MMSSLRFHLFILLVFFSSLINEEFCYTSSELLFVEDNDSNGAVLPLVINTWSFTNATEKAWDVLYEQRRSVLDSVEEGCSVCESEQCDGTVGYGGSPDENGETTLDALIMDGKTHDVGAVGSLRRVKSAISVARRVLENTELTLLVGELATQFALQMGFQEENLTTETSQQLHTDWKNQNCQPNFWKNVYPDPTTSCGPYEPLNTHSREDVEILTNKILSKEGTKVTVGSENHDTIGMIAVDYEGNIAAGTSTNGLNHKIPGRVGDSPIPGAGAYVDRNVGGSAATGDGDVMVRFLPSLMTVERMRNGMTPLEAATSSLQHIVSYYPKFSGALIAVNLNGEYAGVCHGFSHFEFSVVNPTLGGVKVFNVNCTEIET